MPRIPPMNIRAHGPRLADDDTSSGAAPGPGRARVVFRGGNIAKIDGAAVRADQRPEGAAAPDQRPEGAAAPDQRAFQDPMGEVTTPLTVPAGPASAP